MLIILLNKLRVDQISCSRRSGTRWQYGVLKWYEIVKWLGTPGLANLIRFNNVRYLNATDSSIFSLS